MFEVGFCGYNIKNADYGLIDRPNGSVDYLLLLFHAPMVIKTPDGMTNANKGDIFIYPPNTPHWYKAEKTFYNSFVHIMDLSGVFDTLNIPLNSVIRLEEVDKINSTIKKIEYEFYNNSSFRKERLDAYVTLLLTEIAQNLVTNSDNSQISYSLLREFQTVRSIILSNLSKDWNIESMAQMANMSPSRFQYYYKTIFHQTPKADLITARLEYSRQLLSEDKMLVCDIAKLIGYSSEFYYIKAFKKKYGVSPKQYALDKSKSG